jgi:hypothetical protein
MIIEQQNERETPYVGLLLTESSIFTLLCGYSIKIKLFYLRVILLLSV